MSTERDASPGAPEHSPPRLSPPPRLNVPRPADGRRAAAGAGGRDARSAATRSAATRSAATRSAATRSAATLITVALFGVLALAAVAVFVVLPDLVRDRQQTGQTQLVAASRLETASEASHQEAAIGAAGGGAAGGGTGDGGELGDDSRKDVEQDVPAAPMPAASGPPAAPPPASTRRAEPQPRAEIAATAPRRRAAPLPRGNAGTGAGFERAMSEGLTALERKDYSAAREAFARAAALEPGSAQSADGLARAEVGARLAELSTLRERALAFEAQEDWRAAAERYDAALELDPAVEFALAGSARGRRRAELDDRIELHLAKPERMSSDEVLREAAAVLEQASEIDPRSPPLEQQRQRLAAVVTAFSTPVTATLESDQLTEVTVYKVGRLGTFGRRDLDLRPGTYTVVGSRRGYRDVRRQLVIEPGAPPRPLAIRCEEQI